VVCESSHVLEKFSDVSGPHLKEVRCYICSLFQVLGDVDLDLELDLRGRRGKIDMGLHLLGFLYNGTILMFCLLCILKAQVCF